MAMKLLTAILFSVFLPYFPALAGDVVLTANVAETSVQQQVSHTASSTLTVNNLDSTSAQFEFPPSFYSADYDVRIYSYQKSFFEETYPEPSGKNFVGMVYDAQVYAADTENRLNAFSRNVLLTLNYKEADLGGADEATLVPYHRESGDSAWTSISGAVLDTNAHTVTFRTSSFSYFTLMATEPSSDTTNNDSNQSQSQISDSGSGVISWLSNAVSRVVHIFVQEQKSLPVISDQKLIPMNNNKSLNQSNTLPATGNTDQLTNNNLTPSRPASNTPSQSSISSSSQSNSFFTPAILNIRSSLWIVIGIGLMLGMILYLF